MKNRLILCVGLFLLLTAFVADKPVITIFMIGDSTMANKNITGGNPERGWGMVLPGFFAEDIKVDNHAVNGRSSKSFIDEGRWDKVLSLIKKGDYVFIQFGHNDEKPDPKRHTDPGSTFDANLRRFVTETRAKGGIPVLFNSIVRRNYAPVADLSKIDAAVAAAVNQDDVRADAVSGGSSAQVPAERLIDTHGDYLKSPLAVAEELGLRAGIPVTYRAGDQPNNALSLNVFNPGEIASTAGTSGVVYGVNGTVNYDPQSRVNTFAHVNHTDEQTRLGVLLCINGTGILNSWIKRTMGTDVSYAEMNDLAAGVPIGSQGLSVIPFGNGAERVLGNKEPGCSLQGLNFNSHTRAHIMRAAQEGIVFSFKYGMEVMEQMGMHITNIHAGNANMFLSPIFRNTLAGVTGATIELYDTDGSVGAAKGAGMGAGIYKDNTEAFSTLKKLQVIEPDVQAAEQYQAAYALWKERLANVVR